METSGIQATAPVKEHPTIIKLEFNKAQYLEWLNPMQNKIHRFKIAHMPIPVVKWGGGGLH